MRPVPEATGSPSREHNDWSIQIDRFGLSPRRLKIVCVGAGFSGLTLAYKLKHERPLDYVDLVIYEKNNEVGGTWYENVYPGVGCDIPAHSYVFPFEPNPRWSKFYVEGAEIQQYILDTTEKYKLRENITFNTKITKSVWDEDNGKWKIELEQHGSLIHDEADILINGSGILNQWKWPDIEGLHSFQGKLLHSAKWDPNYDYTDKKIAVIGNGSSALQLVPAIQPKASKLVNYIRQPTWVSTNLCGNVTKDQMGTNFAFTEEEKQEFADDPGKFLAYRKYVENSVNFVFRLMLSGSEENKFIHDLVEGVMKQRLARNPHLIEKLIPEYETGCRRLSPGDGYLEALQEENAKWCFSKIKRITANGIETDEGEEEFDLIVCATGFNTSFVPPWKLIGRDGHRLDVAWMKKPEAYFSVCAAGIPNFFMFAGPNCPIGHGSVPQMLAWSGDYMLDWVEKMAVDDIKSIAVKESVVRDYYVFVQENLKRAVWSKGCHTWYNSAKGNEQTPTAMYPGSALHYKAALETIRGEHFDIRYETANPFKYLGNGEMEFERTGGDLSYYLK
ncbi:hypothetical protein AWENTII_011897 [Aspergillus wentii]|nr:hypothetical protein MW887_008352 [Aspergillus wentii]